MKFSGQTKDRAIDNLLRAYVSRPSNPRRVCPDFDPDQANAYIERNLTNAVRLQYEAHLSVCAACRQSVVALMRMAEADSLTTMTPPSQVPQTAWRSRIKDRIKEMFGALSQPQWAMAAAAVIVLAVSLPLFMSRNQTRETSQTFANQSSDQPVGAASPVTALSNPGSDQAPAALVPAERRRENTDDRTATLAKSAPAPATPEAAGFAAGGELSKKTDARNAAEPLDDLQRKAENQAVPAPAQAGAAPASQVAGNDADKNRQQQPEKDSTAQQTGEGKLAARVDELRAKEKTERAEDVAAPPAPPASEAARGRSSMRRPGRLALRDSDAAEAVRPEERKFSGKKFLFKDGAWTDKDFDPNKDLPVVTIIRDSNVYQEVLSKRPGLKPFLTGFPATARAIIVYKGTVYKLIPQ